MSKTFNKTGADHSVREDIEAALNAGILTEIQASRFLALVADRNTAAGDEPFTVFRGTNEIFIIAGFGPGLLAGIFDVWRPSGIVVTRHGTDVSMMPGTWMRRRDQLRRPFA